MLNKKHRITKQKEFDQFFGKQFKQNNGRNISSQGLLLKILPSELDYSRFGFMISNKVDKRATTRNRLKRQIREVVRLNLQNLKGKVDALLIINSAMKGKEYSEIEKEVLSLLRKAGLL